MPYAAINSRRMPFDIDGTEVGYRQGGDMTTTFGQGVGTWLDSTAKGNLNKNDRSQQWGGNGMNLSNNFWFFFPESREITHLAFEFTGSGSLPGSFLIQGSSDSTNGMDGAWETATYSMPTNTQNLDNWRKCIFAVSLSGPVKVLRVGMHDGGGYVDFYISGIHVYGMKADGQTPDDVVFCSADGTEYTTLKDYGDTPEGSTYNDTFYLKNVSTKQANNLNLQLNNADYVISVDQTNWGAVVNITSLSSGQVSQPIYVRKTLGPPLLTLGPRAARVILTIGSFS